MEGARFPNRKTATWQANRGARRTFSARASPRFPNWCLGGFQRREGLRILDYKLLLWLLFATTFWKRRRKLVRFPPAPWEGTCWGWLVAGLKFRSNPCLTSSRTAAGYNPTRSSAGRVITIRAHGGQQRALPLPEGTSLAPCTQPGERPSILGGAFFFLPKMKGKKRRWGSRTNEMNPFQRKVPFQIHQLSKTS